MATSIGLDLGSRFIKVVQVMGTKDAPKITHAKMVEISQTPTEEMDPATRTELMIKTVKTLMAESGVKGKKVNAALSGEAVIVRVIKMPVMSKADLKNAIQFEAEQYIPMKIDQVVIDLHVQREIMDEGQKKQEVILVAAKQEAVSELLGLLTATGLQPGIIDYDPFCLHNHFELNYGMTKGETVAVLHCGSKISTLMLIEDGLFQLGRDLPLAGNTLTKDIQGALKMDFPLAEELKRTQGQLIVESEESDIERLPDKEDKTLRMHEAMLPTINRLIGEIRRSFDFYEAQGQKRGVNKVLLSGGGALLKNFQGYLGEKFKIPVEPFQSFTHVEVPPALKESLDPASPQWAVAVNLAIRGL